MKKHKIIYIWLSLILIPFLGRTQSLTEAVLFSEYDIMGTARTVGVGGAFGAMGGDYTSIMINPSGIGEYKKSEFTITPSYEQNSTQSFFVADRESTSSREHNKIGLDNIAFVISRSRNNKSLINSNFAIGYNKVNSFNSDYSLNGRTLGSITERFIELANGKSLDQLDEFEAGLAYDALALIGPDSDNFYSDDFADDDYTDKLQIVNQRGSLSEISLGWGGNIKNKVNVGVSLGFPILRYEETKNYRQTLAETNFSNSLEYYQKNKVTGSGVNLRIGATYKPMRALRLGLAIHTPTAFVLNNEYLATIDYTYVNGNDSGSGSSESPLGTFKYDFSTPMKIVASVGSIFKTGDVAGFINLDWENQNFRNASFDLGAYSDSPDEIIFSDELNAEIDDRLTTVNNIRLGGELAYESFRLRAGYNLIYSGYNGEDEAQNAWSLGTGYNSDNFFIDLAYRKLARITGYNPYYLEESARDPLANIDTDEGRFMVTVGFRM